MRAMILAAGRGERMGALTAHIPKPLLRVGNDCLIEYTLFNLQKAGITEIVINLAYHGEKIKQALGNGERYGVNIAYSEEKQRLETGGGILQALPLLGDDAFIVLSADIITDYPLQNLPKEPIGLGHLIMVANPSYHSHGDFGLQDGYLQHQATNRLTFANISVLRPALFAGCQPGHFRLVDLLMPAIKKKQFTGEYYTGLWYNIGTPADLAEASVRVLSS